MADFVGALDQGTTSTRFMIFDHAGREVGKHQLEHEQILPRAGWVEGMSGSGTSWATSRLRSSMNT